MTKAERSQPNGGQEITLPEPSPALIEVHRILTDSGFTVAPIAYVDREKGEVTHAIIETVVRPDYTDGTEMYYKNPDEDPLAQILERVRTRRHAQGVAVPHWERRVPSKSRFGLSWDEIHGFVVPEVVKTVHHLKETIRNRGIAFRVPTKAEYQFAGESYPLGAGDNIEWLYDRAPAFVGDWLRSGRCASGFTVDHGWLPETHSVSFGFRLQAVSRPQKLPR